MLSRRGWIGGAGQTGGLLLRSLSGRLLVLWSLSLAASVLSVLLLAGFARQSMLAGDERAMAVAQTGCGLIREQVAFYSVGVPPGAELPPPADLAAVAALGLAELPGTTGGIWREGVPVVAVRGGRPGSMAASGGAFPGPGALAPLVAQAERDDRAVQGAVAAGPATLAIATCVLPGPWPGLVGWVASPGGGRVGEGLPAMLFAAAHPGLGLGVGALLLLILGIGLWSSRLLLAWRRALARLEAAVRGTAGKATLRPAGEPGLDRVIAALNETALRLEAAQAREAAASRLAALGRVAAGVAHEVRNPIAAIRLRAENAIAGSEQRRAAALPAILEQVSRLERLTHALLDMTTQHGAVPLACDLRALCGRIASARLAQSGRAGEIALDLQVMTGEARLDEALLEASLGNLVLNAAQHARTLVRVEGGVVEGMVRLVVSDDGAGVDPALGASLFDPFVTGRADGTGLGLAIAREAASAHGGGIRLDETAGAGARFVLEIPQ